MSTAPFVIFDEFLVAEEWQALTRYVHEHSHKFTATRVIRSHGDAEDNDYRRSRVLFQLDGFYDLFAQRIMTFLPHIVGRIGCGPFPILQRRSATHGH